METLYRFVSVVLMLFFIEKSDAIYPKDLWEYSTYLANNKQAFDSHIEAEILAGRTVIVRFIAGEM